MNKIIEDPAYKFTPDQMEKQSFAASKLCAWAVNIVKFNTIFKIVDPLEKSRDEALAQLE